MLDKLKTELTNITTQLQNLIKSKEVCDSMVATASIKIIEVKEQKEGELQPVELNINGDVLVKAVLAPMYNLISQRKEAALTAKEKVLALIEAEIIPKDEEVKPE